ncbi:MAG: siderophore-interacting protein, partial [Pseudomonadota bacterium]
VLHDLAGPAGNWLNTVKTGDSITIGGPGSCRMIDPNADWFLIAGDMSALPAIAVNVERLPKDAVGYVVVEVIAEDDQIDLSVPPGVDLHWMVNPHPNIQTPLLSDKVLGLPWRDGIASVWVAGEFSASRTIRQYLRNTRQVSRDAMYASCYWKIGDSDEGMKRAKRLDSDAW